MLRGLDDVLGLIPDALAARRGDVAARGRLIRRAVPLAADVVRPGAGRLVRRGLEVLDQTAGQDDGDGTRMLHTGAELPDYSPFVERLLSRPYGFYVIVGEPGSGKTTLALRLASRLATERNFRVIAVGGLHPDDRHAWATDEWVEAQPPTSFLKAMATVSRAMVKQREYPRQIMRRVVLLDDASLIAHAGAQRFGRALLQAWNVYRHLHWVIVVTARTFKSCSTVAEGADARFLKRPVWQQLAGEREHAIAWWEEAETAYKQLRHTDDWADRPSEREWVYVQAPRLHFTGLMPYAGPDAFEMPTTRLADLEPINADELDDDDDNAADDDAGLLEL